MSDAHALAEAERLADEVTRRHADAGTTVAEALAMPWGGERNCAFRAALGLRDGEVGVVSQGEVAQVVVADHARARQVAPHLKAALGHGSTVSTVRRADGCYLVTGHRA